MIPSESKKTTPHFSRPLLCLNKVNHEPIVAVFSADYFIPEQNFFAFMRHIELALEIIEADDPRIVLLGLEPMESDPVRGCIIPGPKIGDAGWTSLRSIEMFVEKPARKAATKLVKSGALWNTQVFVCGLKTLRTVFQRQSPDFYRSLEAASDAIEISRINGVIEHPGFLLSINFFKDVLQSLSYEQRRNFFVLPISRSAFFAGRGDFAFEQDTRSTVLYSMRP
jgi:mannose-1-phosphate guanylyltransferase